MKIEIWVLKNFTDEKSTKVESARWYNFERLNGPSDALSGKTDGVRDFRSQAPADSVVNPGYLIVFIGQMWIDDPTGSSVRE